MIKNIFHILLLAIYLTSTLRPIIPILNYFNNYDYIAKELCENRNKPVLKCNGTCYVEKMMKDADLLVKNDNSPKSIIPSKDMFFPIFILETFEYSISILIERIKLLTFYKLIEIKQLVNSIFRPPQISILF